MLENLAPSPQSHSEILRIGIFCIPFTPVMTKIVCHSKTVLLGCFGSIPNRDTIKWLKTDSPSREEQDKIEYIYIYIYICICIYIYIHISPKYDYLYIYIENPWPCPKNSRASRFSATHRRRPGGFGGPWCHLDPCEVRSAGITQILPLRSQSFGA